MYERLNPSDAKQRLDEGWIHVDVRTVHEFEEGHVPGSYNVPVLFFSETGREMNPDFVAVMKRNFPKDAKLVFG